LFANPHTCCCEEWNGPKVAEAASDAVVGAAEEAEAIDEEEDAEAEVEDEGMVSDPRADSAATIGIHAKTAHMTSASSRDSSNEKRRTTSAPRDHVTSLRDHVSVSSANSLDWTDVLLVPEVDALAALYGVTGVYAAEEEEDGWSSASGCATYCFAGRPLRARGCARA
jgi:hypothetical protein